LDCVLPSICLQCFDAVGLAAGRASGLYKTEWWGAGMVICLERARVCVCVCVSVSVCVCLSVCLSVLLSIGKCYVTNINEHSLVH